MKILLINTVCGVTSTGKICTDLAQTLSEDNTVKIAYGRDDKGMPERFAQYAIKIGSNIDVIVHGIKTRLFDKHGLGSKKATRNFLNWIDTYNPDIIHLHNLHGYYINIQLLFEYLKKKNIPVVWTFHDCWPMTGHCTHFNAYGCNKWIVGCNHCQLKENYPTSKGVDNSYNNFLIKKNTFTGINNMMIITPSIWLKTIVEQSFLKEYQVKVINNGIDTDIFKPRKSNIKEQFSLQGKKIVLGVANGWGPHKGLNYLKHLSLDLPDDWQVVIIGLSDEQLNEIPQCILGIKRTNNAIELAEWYSVADVYVNPTLEDTYPTTNLEAQACGTPVVTFDSDGAAETIMSQGGFVVNRLDYNNLLAMTVEAAKLKENFHGVQIKDKKDLAMEYKEIYKEMMEKTK